MTIRNCRVCARPFFKDPLLRYENMPRAAQHFPDEASLEAERGVNLTVCQCSECGLVQLSEPPVPYYRDVIRAAAVSEPVTAFKTEQFSRLAEKYGLQGKKVIEIGCGKGEFLSLWKNSGVQAYGLEHAETSVRHCLENGLSAFQGYLDASEFQLPNGPFDAFALLMFLEHMPDPNASLRGIRNNLAEDAVGLIEVPNFDMVVRNHLFSEFIADHLMYFTRDTLQFTLQLNGFEILECSELRDDYVLSAIVRKRKSLDLLAFHAAQDSVRQEIETFIDRFPPKSVAIWGAGHQALAMISLTGIAGKIKYVVDSAPFKQGKFTPASHLPIVSPDTLNQSPASALIVMAASYSDEVAGIVRQRYGNDLPLSILRESHLEIV
jgi:2-polyprenyl-3-methyl-5-hydroxy-6-metoxy-1,4-benzoquinol methylase